LISSLSRACQPPAAAGQPARDPEAAASASMTTERTGLGSTGWGSACTAVTLPAMLACTGADTKDLDSPIFWPRATVSPSLTRASQGAPVCCCRGITTRAGAGSTSMGLPRVASLRSGAWTPPLNVFNLMFCYPVVWFAFPPLFGSGRLCSGAVR
jgi:hypothetical protein